MSEQLLLPAFENEILEINIEELHFSKDVPPQLLMGRKFQVKSSFEINAPLGRFSLFRRYSPS